MSNMVVQTNVMALNSHRNLSMVGTNQSKASQRLSSGYRINSAADDAAGLAISEKMRSQIRGLDMASKNAQDSISLIQTAEGGMQEIDNMLQRIRELVDQASNDTNDTASGDRQKIQDEIDEYVKEIDKMAERVEFNKKRLINGEALGADEKNEMIQKVQSKLSNLIGTQTAVSLATASGDGKLGAAMANVSGALSQETQVSSSLIATNTTTSTTDTIVSSSSTYSGMVTDTITTQYIIKYSEISEYAAGGSLSSLSLDSIVSATEISLAASDYASLSSLLSVDGTNTSAVDTETTSTSYSYDITSIDVTALVTEYTTSTTTITLTTGVAAYTDAITDKSKINDQLLKIDSYITSITGKGLTNESALLQSANDIKDALKNAGTYAAQADGFEKSLASLNKVTGNGLYFQVGANANQGFSISIASIKTDILGIGNGNGVSTISVIEDTGAKVTTLLDTLDTALSFVTTERSKLGAYQNRLEYAQKSLDISSENLSAAESRIRDTDMAKEMMKYTQANVLQQAATSMLAQANQAPQNVLQLLR